MGGSGINQAKQALQLFLHSLPLDCYVNIAGFGSSYKELFPASRKYDESLLNLTKQHVDSIDANLGGTEIFHPLETIFKKPSIEGYLRQIFVLTDGEVSNADEILGLIRRQNGQARVFALGLGSSASHYLVEGMARAGNGTALFASLEERLEKKVMQQLQDSLQPALSDIKIKWDGYEETGKKLTTANAVPVQTEKTLMGFGKLLESGTPVPTEKAQLKFRQAPTADMVPAVFDGKHLIVYALLTEDAHVPKWAEVIAKSPVGPLTLKVHLNESNSEEGQLIHCLAAKKLIQARQDSEGDPDSIEDSKSTETKQEIIQLGCQYGLASRYTSYVAVDPKEQKEMKKSWMMMKSRDVPVQLAHACGGYQALGAFADGCDVVMNISADVCDVTMGITDDSCSDYTEHVDCEVDDYSVDDIQFTLSPSEGTENETSNTDDDKLLKLITCQNFDGSFQLESALAELLHTTSEDIKQAAEKNSYSEQVWATADVALAFMGIALADLQTTWMLVAKKAENWIRSSGKLNGDETACTSAAQEYVKAKLSLLILRL